MIFTDRSPIIWRMSERLGSGVGFFVEKHPERLNGKPRWQALEELLEPSLQLIRESGLIVCAAIGEEDILGSDNEKTAKVLRRIGEEGNLVGWFTLPDSKGYFGGQRNIAEYVELVEGGIDWAARNDVNFRRIGADYEPDIIFTRRVRESFAGALVAIMGRRLILARDPSLRESFQKGIDRIAKIFPAEAYVCHPPLDRLFGMNGFDYSQYDQVFAMVYGLDGLGDWKIRGRTVREYLSGNQSLALGNFSHSPDARDGRIFPHEEKVYGPDQLRRVLRSLGPFEELRIFALTGLEVLTTTTEVLNEVGVVWERQRQRVLPA